MYLLILSIIILLFAGSLTSIAGIGGGAILLPVYYIIAEYDLDESILLAVLTVVGNALIRVIYYLTHSQKELVNYDIIRIIVPFDTAMGTYGFILNKILPNWIVVGLVISILSTILLKTTRKTRKIRAEELIIISGENSATAPTPPLTPPPHIHTSTSTSTPFRKNIKYLVLFFLIIAGQTLLITKFNRLCSYHYWIVTGVFTAVNLLLGFCIYSSSALKSKGKLAFFAANTGWVSSLLGIGGGILINPLLLHNGFQPEEIVATTSITIFFSGAVSSLQYLTAENLELKYYDMIGAFLVGLFSSSIGTYISVNHIKRKSYIFIILLVLIALSFLILTTFTVIDLINEGFQGMRDLCEAE